MADAVVFDDVMDGLDLPDCGLDLCKEGECGRTGLWDDTDDLDGLCRISSSSSSPVDEKLKSLIRFFRVACPFTDERIRSAQKL